MSARPRVRPRALLVLLLVSSCPSLALAAPKVTDHVRIRADASRFPLRRIAVLPVVSPGDAVARTVEEQWLLHFIDDGHDWVPPEISAEFMSALSSRKPDSVWNAIHAQVFKQGFPDTLRAPFLARVLHSQALLSIRVDRWERVVEPDARITTAFVELTATLVDSAGEGAMADLGRTAAGGEVRRSSGGPRRREHRGRNHARGQQGGHGAAEGVDRHRSGRHGRWQLRMGEGKLAATLAPDFRLALTALLDRWRAAYPFAHPAAASRTPAP